MQCFANGFVPQLQLLAGVAEPSAWVGKVGAVHARHFTASPSKLD
jgi:hypothetical protein